MAPHATQSADAGAAYNPGIVAQWESRRTEYELGGKRQMQPELLDGLEWRLIGPFRGGRCVAVAGDPNDVAVFYFGSTGGGVWKTTDGGQYWHNVSDGFFQRASVGAIAVAPSDPNVIYVGMGETTIRGNVSHGDGVYKSTDAGKTWTHRGLAATRNIGKVRVDPRNPDVVYVAAFGHAHGPNAERGLYQSKDGGTSWDLVLSRGENAGANDLSIDPHNPRIVYASFWEARRGPSALTSGGPGSALFKSTDGGTTWTELTNNQGMPRGLKGKIGVAASPAKSGRVWAIVEAEEGGVYRSDDGGETWERLNEDRTLRQRAWYYSHIYADPLAADTVWVLNVEMFKSVDGGKTFAKVPVPHGDNHDLWIDPRNPRRMILGNDGGGTVTFNGGISWSTLYNQPTAEMYHVITDSQTPYRVYGAQQDNSTITVPSRSNHEAITASEQYEIGGGESGYIAVRPDDPNIVYAGSYQGYLTRYDHRAGQNRTITVWPEEYSGSGAKVYKYRFNWTFPTILSPHDPQALYCGGNHVFRSRDEGTTWETISPDLSRDDPSTQEPSGGPITKDNTGAEVYGTVFTLAESERQAGVLWVGTDDGLVHVSRDGGASWANVTPPTLPEWALISIVEASPHDPAAAYVAATRYKHDDFQPYLFKTADYGTTWSKITAGIPENVFTRVVREDPARRGLLYTGTEVGIYVSCDDGGSWRRMGGNLPVVPIHDFVIRGNDLVIATHGRSFWILDDLTLIQQMAAATEPAAVATLYTPRDAYRFGRLPGFGAEPVPGQNYSFAGTLIPAYLYSKSADGEVKRTFLDAGTNPPDGVIVQYALAGEPKGELTLTFLDAGGTEIRTVKSKKKDDETADATKEPEFPPPVKREDDKDEEPFVPARAGLNRFVWNLRYPDVTKIASKGGDKPERSGPLAVPGDYQVRLTVDGATSTATFRILKDPRVNSSPEDLETQLALLMRLHDKHDEINKAVNQIRTMRGQVEEWARRTKDGESGESIVAAAKALAEQLDAVEGELMQVKIQSKQDSLNYPVKLNGKLVALAGAIASADTAPTKQARELADDLIGRTDAQLATLKTVLAEDVPALNALIKAVNAPAVAAPAV